MTKEAVLTTAQLIPGPDGQTGTKGDPGNYWHHGTGAPSGISTPKSGDLYLDTNSSDLYSYTNTWGMIGNVKGAIGSGATVSTGTTTTGSPGTSATVSNSGTSTAAIFNFVIPRGNVGLQGNDGTPKRIEKYTGNLGASGTVTFTFGTAFASTPLWIGDMAWSGNQAFSSYATAISTTSITIKAKRSRGTLLLTSGPYEDAVSGEPYSIIVTGN